jgi:hypothetical protein
MADEKEKQQIEEGEVGKLEDVLDPKDSLVADDDAPKPIHVNAGVAEMKVTCTPSG